MLQVYGTVVAAARVSFGVVSLGPLAYSYDGRLPLHSYLNCLASRWSPPKEKGTHSTTVSGQAGSPDGG